MDGELKATNVKVICCSTCSNESFNIGWGTDKRDLIVRCTSCQTTFVLIDSVDLDDLNSRAIQ